MRPPGPAGPPGPPGPPGPLELPTFADAAVGSNPTLTNATNTILAWGTHTPLLHLPAQTRFLLTGWMLWLGTGVTSIPGRAVDGMLTETLQGLGEIGPQVEIMLPAATLATVHGILEFSFEYTTGGLDEELQYEGWLRGALTAGTIQMTEAILQAQQLCETGTA